MLVSYITNLQGSDVAAGDGAVPSKQAPRLAGEHNYVLMKARELRVVPRAIVEKEHLQFRALPRRAA